MSYPLSKYKFISHNNEIIAISTYAGKTVKGIAKCSDKDTFDEQSGKSLAAARCNMKVANKRAKNAEVRLDQAIRNLHDAKQYYTKMVEYYNDSIHEKEEAKKDLQKILEDL